ncbi:urea transporter [Nocardioides campestrisoli]|uniref:urea transporter n=1 Tax=Nocardioides campestrisoli TaxID=2736757 RepID=UPI0015E704F6|nr:urea transporter [Nocardioides campestrisoli]
MWVTREVSDRLEAVTWRALCRGPAQIFFQRSPWTGLLIMAAFLVADWQMAVLAAIGTVVSTLSGCVLRFSADNVALGMQGFNGCLLGAAMFAALGTQGWAYLLTAVGSVVAALLTAFFAWLLASDGLKAYNLPYTTAPFCTAASIMYAASTSVHLDSTAKHVTDGTGEAFWRSILSNVSEVVLVNSAWGGALILIGLFISSWKVGLAALMGSVIGTLCAFAMGETNATLDAGLAGYAGVLTAIALAVTFHHSSTASWLYAAFGAVVTAVVTLLMNDATTFPHYTWPYILPTWVLLVVGASFSFLKRT